ncbi:MAG: hypothetical protein EPO20_11350 [Betaproteobacteria bacterium]|nr:MAG: hypothetical protein EPO20_11350 [Betaproteobacteria bacterium]
MDPWPPGGCRNCDVQESGEGKDGNRLSAQAKELLFYVPEQVDSIVVYGRAVLLAAIAFYGVRLAMMDIPSWEMSSSLIHLPMVPIHEFGHVVFRPFGEFVMLLGGSLFQIALPLVFGGIFLVKNRDPFAASVMLRWSAAAVTDVAPYIYDARAPQHVLLTGRTGDSGAHDFIDVLGPRRSRPRRGDDAPRPCLGRSAGVATIPRK